MPSKTKARNKQKPNDNHTKDGNIILSNELNTTLIVQPKGRRKKLIIITAHFLENETIVQQQERNEALAKQFAHFGLHTERQG